MHNADRSMKVAICVITFRRPAMLTALLESVNRLTFTRYHPDVELVVVDNDTQGLAREVCDAVRPTFQWKLHCFEEERRGIPFARNKAIASAPSDADFIAFVDDDETVEPDWLDELLHVQEKHNADVVTGPALPRFEGAVPNWIIKGRFFYPARHPDGSVREFAHTGNVLLRAAVCKSMDMLFDERMALTGGSDTHFFMRVHSAGYKIVWANNALTHESVPASRVTVRWIIQRTFRFGNAITLRRRDLSPSPITLILLFAEGWYSILQGVFLFPIGLVVGRHILMNSGRRFFRGVGILSGLVGVRYEEYRRTHGS